MPNDREIEARFLEINKEELIKKLRQLGAQDLGEDFLRETIFYDRAGSWVHERKLIRIRTNSKNSIVSYKHHENHAIDGTKEVEFYTSEPEKVKQFLLELGFLEAMRQQEKYRHTFQLDDVTVDIDTWPQIPTYVELEGSSEVALHDAAEKLGLDWGKAVFEDARQVIEKYYHIPVSSLKYFTFDRIE
jgi:adenylate cyclase, class 2